MKSIIQLSIPYIFKVSPIFLKPRSQIFILIKMIIHRLEGYQKQKTFKDQLKQTARITQIRSRRKLQQNRVVE
ncbi:unnamed protein product [Paramecium sonneborni]|uniref:Uncharacterized protein n=1 Tax=Paramecium sonneborni TaxID=65129 RepID=A0A8S1MYH8_9CILI|nr:unnamed protein product [Paramecium sonneborni]